MKTLPLAVAVLLAAACLAGCGDSGYDYDEAEGRRSDFVAEPRRVPKPKTCSDYTNAHEILLDERAGKLTKADKQWLDMDGDGRYCEERGVAWKGERSHTE
jgi:hypothetical protein